MTVTAPPATTTPLFGARYRAATAGSVALIFVAAFESLAVATVMPTVAADLGGEQWYALAFSATVAAGVVGMVAAGTWADRVGAARPLLASVALFAVGLLLAGLTPSMEGFVLGRFAQGLGGGGLTVALYVLVAQVYDEVDRPRVLGVWAAAWVVPGLVGPALAGVVADVVGWRWVFLGVVAIAAAAVLVLVPTLISLRSPDGEKSAPVPPAGDHWRRLGLAVVVAASILLVSLSPGSGATGAVLALAAVVAALAAVRPLLPVGTFRGAPGLPAVIGVRGLAAAAFFASEAYLPYLLQAQYDVEVWVSGLVLTAATLGWAGASQVQGRLGARAADATLLRTGAALVLAGVAGILLVAAGGLPALLVGVGWLVTAAGMGLLYPRATSAVLARASAAERGNASAAIALSDATGAATALAVTGLVFTAAGGADVLGAFVAVLALTTALGALGVAVSRRA
ncbi:MFS transporter [Nocardioides taihuensis]|uniref:MFS transporter n=1 Tax=Nocardioides taihuensis TaxID=1835606 RepID=A0ABW0BKB7_9ACTN